MESCHRKSASTYKQSYALSSSYLLSPRPAQLFSSTYTCFPTHHGFLSHFPKLTHFTILQRDKAWAIHTYPCVGENYFLKPFIQKHPALQHVRTMLQGPESRLIDIGCGFGQDLRFLAANVGIDSTKLSGLDLDQEMIDLGYELFNDRNTGTFDAHFETGDMLKLSSTHAHLTNKFDVVHATCALHLFDHDTQVLACENVLRLLKPGGLLLGSQVGRTTVTTLANGMYLNNETSFAELFKKASGKVGVQCEVDSQLLPFEHELMSTIRVDPELRLFVFSVKTKVSQ